MKKLSIFIYLIIFLLITSVKSSFAIDSDIQDLINEVEGAQESIKELDESKLEEAIKIDSAVEEINKATEFVKEALENNDNENAIKALEFIEKSLAGVGSLIPDEFSSNMSKADLDSFAPDKMKVVNELTAGMSVKKEEDLNKLVTNMIDLESGGLDSFGITENLNKLGIETVKLDITLKKAEQQAATTVALKKTDEVTAEVDAAKKAATAADKSVEKTEAVYVIAVAAREKAIKNLDAINSSNASEAAKQAAHNATMEAKYTAADARNIFQKAQHAAGKTLKETQKSIDTIRESAKAVAGTTDNIVEAVTIDYDAHFPDLKKERDAMSVGKLAAALETAVAAREKAVENLDAINSSNASEAVKQAAHEATMAAKYEAIDSKEAFKKAAVAAGSSMKEVQKNISEIQETAKAAAAVAEAVEVAVTIDYDAHFPDLKEARDAMSVGDLADAVQAAGAAREAALQTLIALEESSDATEAELKAAHDALMKAKYEAIDSKEALKKAQSQ